MTIQVKVWITKDGTTKTASYDGKKYSADHYQKHKDQYSQRIPCECGGSYQKSGKTAHMNSRKCQIGTEIRVRPGNNLIDGHID